MQAGYYKLESKGLEGFNLKLKTPYYNNTVNSLSGTFEATFSVYSLDVYKKVNKVLTRDKAIDVIFTNDVYSYRLMGAILQIKTITIKNEEFAFEISLTHPTYKMQKIYSTPFKNFYKDDESIGVVEEVPQTAQQCIERLFISTKIIYNKDTKESNLYQRIIYPLRTTKASSKIEKKLDSDRYSGNSESVFQTLQVILNDANARVFTTNLLTKSKEDKINKKQPTTLYIHDTGEFLDEIPQAITNINLLKAKTTIKYDKFYDKVNIDADESISGFPIDFRDYGQQAVFRDNKQANKQMASLNIYGIKNITNPQIDLPAIIFNKTLSVDSNNSDLNDYANMLIKNSLDEGISIDCEVNSMFIDVTNPQKGIWQLGGKITIENDLLNKFLEDDFGNYLKNSKNFFVIKAIQTTGTSAVKLILGLNDLIRFND